MTLSYFYFFIGLDYILRDELKHITMLRLSLRLYKKQKWMINSFSSRMV